MTSARALSIRSHRDAERELIALGIDHSSIDNFIRHLLHHVVLVDGIDPADVQRIERAVTAGGGVAIVGARESGSLIIAGTSEQLKIYCSSVASEESVLSHLGRRIERLLVQKEDPPHIWKVGRRTISLDRPCIMGILNVTPDSFSDGGRFADPDRAIDRALEMEAAGADIIDIGGESTRPFAPAVDAAEELRRVMPVIEKLTSQVRIPLSVDTYKAVVAHEALSAGAEIVNDISGLMFDDRMAAVVSDHRAGLVLMHTRDNPREMQKKTSYDSVVSEIISYLERSMDRALAAGIEPQQIAVDPGVGFGKDSSGNLTLLRRLSEFKSLGCPILIGTSRKSFIGKILGREMDQRVFGTAATVAAAYMNGASILRVHDVQEMRDVVDMVSAILNADA